MNAEEKMRRAEEAGRLLNDPLLKEAFEAIERNHFEAALAAKETRARDELLDRILAIRFLRTHLQSVITDGKQAARIPPVVV